MKRSIVYLGVVLFAFSNVSLAANSNKFGDNKSTLLLYNEVTPFINAICNGDVEAVKKFIDYGEDVNATSNGLSPLMIAARYNKVEIIKILLAHGANLKTKDYNGFTALKHAELSNAKDAVPLLTKA